jgi:hypothetical protein
VCQSYRTPPFTSRFFTARVRYYWSLQSKDISSNVATSNGVWSREVKGERKLKIEDLIAELAVFPLNNKIHIKVDGEIRYIREVKIKEPSQNDVVVVEVL